MRVQFVCSTGFKKDVCCFYRNYHVFYYLLLGASEEERKEFKLLPPEDYFYLKQVQYCSVSRCIQQSIVFTLDINGKHSLNSLSFYLVTFAQPW